MKKSESLLKDILSSLKTDHDVWEIRTCVFWTAVCSLRCGLASTMAFSIRPSEGPQVESAGHLLPTGAIALARLSLSSRILERAIGMAAINSVVPIDESQCAESNAEEEIRSCWDRARLYPRSCSIMGWTSFRVLSLSTETEPSKASAKGLIFSR